MKKLLASFSSYYTYSKLAVIVIIICFALQAVCNIGEVFLLQSVIDGIQDPQKIILQIVLLCLVYIFGYMKEPAVNYAQKCANINLRQIWEPKILEKISRISYSRLEEQQTQELISCTKENVADRVGQSFCCFLEMSFALVYVAAMFIIFTINIPLYTAVLVLLIALFAWVYKKTGKIRESLFDSRQKLTRYSFYLQSLAFDRTISMERKLFDCSDVLYDIYKKEVKQANKSLKGKILALNTTTSVYQLVCILFSLSAYLFLLAPLLSGKITIGFYMALIPAIKRLGQFCITLLSSYMPELKENAILCGKLESLSKLEEKWYTYDPDKTASEIKSVCFEDVSFTYPNTEKQIFNHLNLTLDANKSYALVGENGCGKSTLIKLMLGLYQPDSGRIYVDDVNIKDMDFGDLQEKMSVLFQDFGRYDLTVAQNISLHDDPNPDRLEKAALKSTFCKSAENSSKKFNTFLGKRYAQGAELSGGQWQKLAIARMLYSEKPFLILDEPTAALDPLAESEIYQLFLSQMRDKKGSLLVTHRLAATTFVDEILVLKDKGIAEKGNHKELILLNGYYAEMFNSQKEFYS